LVAAWPLVAPPLLDAASAEEAPPLFDELEEAALFEAGAAFVLDLVEALEAVALVAVEDLLLDVFELLPDLLAPSAGAEAAVFVDEDWPDFADDPLDEPLAAGAAALAGA
jgi:hypothetical protein